MKIKAMFQTTNQLNNGERSKLTLQKKKIQKAVEMFRWKESCCEKGIDAGKL
jgi:hypothetical protein